MGYNEDGTTTKLTIVIESEDLDPNDMTEIIGEIFDNVLEASSNTRFAFKIEEE